jgi:hypothetical protein
LRYWPQEAPDGTKIKESDVWKFWMNRPFFLVFQCASCLQQRAVFALETRMKESVGIVQKVGHSPSPRIGMDGRLAKAMGDDVSLFRKGLTSEAHGFGVGAYAYFRQVAENLVDGLLKKLKAEGQASEDSELLGAIEGLSPRARPSEKIGIVKDHLPASLRPGGLNPLGAIYAALSEGIHAGTDEACLQEARVLREALTFVVQELADRKEKRDAYVAAVRGLGGTKA